MEIDGCGERGGQGGLLISVGYLIPLSGLTLSEQNVCRFRNGDWKSRSMKKKKVERSPDTCEKGIHNYFFSLTRKRGLYY